MKKLRKPPPEPKANLHPVAKTPHKVKIKDVVEGHHLAEVNGSGSPLRLGRRTLPGTYLRIVKKTKEVRNMVTIMPDNLLVAWDTCGACHGYFSLCRCSDGISVPRCIEYIYDSTVACQAKEEWTHKHPNYLGSLTRVTREARSARSASGTPFGPVRVIEGSEVVSGPSDKAQRGALTAPSRRTSPAPAQERPTAMPKEATDLGALNAAASSSSDELMKTLTKKLRATPPPTPLPKKPAVKVLRKR